MAEPKKIRVTYDGADGQEYLPVTGAVGGPSPDGATVIAHVFTEHPSVPVLEQHEVAEDGSVDFSKGTKQQRSDLSRRILATLVMTPDAADRIGKWLVQKSKDAAKNRANVTENAK